MSIFEVIMLVSFGAAWPLSIYKSCKTRSVEGKSFVFLLIVFIGYLSGIINKILYSSDWVIYLYVLNLLMVFADMILYIKNKNQKNISIKYKSL